MIEQILIKIKDIILAPITHPEMIWISLPLLISLVLIELYFGKYSKEELGWNSALSNSMLLSFVGLDLFRKLFTISGNKLVFCSKILVALGVTTVGFAFLYMNFYHKLPKKLAFTLNSVIPTNLTAYFAQVLVYTEQELTLAALISFITIYLGTWLFFSIVHIFETKGYDS
ncbi:hypothetical protein JW930_04225 [Candidatus Woesearchaeota archaeon]|nr:hypothetical protein [Candidatus Woesearchaeota archaeon]